MDIEIVDYLFETSWEVCNKVGGIHTVISTKALTLVEKLKGNYILIGPDVWRDTMQNPEFQEDIQLFKSWRGYAAEEGLGLKIGRWNISGNPIVVIVDFMNFVPQKDNIFKKFWELYKLDSLAGQWDYIEPALFGYAAGKVIESFTHFHLSIRDKVVAQFHEWMTGTGVLYLKHFMPQIATTFTTHATVVGRSIAGNQLPLYGKLNQYNGDVIASEFNVIAKQSLEKLSAKNADSFTTVSEITSRECAQFLDQNVDIVTPNGFEDSFVPKGDEALNWRITARKKLIETAASLTNLIFDDKSLRVGIGGRYEYKNKGIDLFIDSLGKVNKSSKIKHPILAFICIPANHYGPRKDLQNILNTVESSNTGEKILTHNLHDVDFDPIIKNIKNVGLTNEPGQHVFIFFVPCYLHGYDGIFDIPYYQVLSGFDLSVFPSYYEPWGYTPLESIAFSVPTVTTSLAGFGLWVHHEPGVDKDAITIIDRDDDNDIIVVDQITERILEFSGMSTEQTESLRSKAFELSKIALWKNFISYYVTAYDMAMRKAGERSGQLVEIEETEQIPHVDKFALI